MIRSVVPPNLNHGGIHDYATALRRCFFFFELVFGLLDGQARLELIFSQ